MTMVFCSPSLRGDRGQVGCPKKSQCGLSQSWLLMFSQSKRFLFTSQTFCITVFIADSVLSMSLSDMTPGSFVCSGTLTGVIFCAAVLHLFWHVCLSFLSTFAKTRLVESRIFITVFVLELSVWAPSHEFSFLVAALPCVFWKRRFHLFICWWSNLLKCWQ